MLVKDCDDLKGKFILINPTEFFEVIKVMSEIIFGHKVIVSHYFNSFTTYCQVDIYEMKTVENNQVVDKLPIREEKEYTL